HAPSPRRTPWSRRLARPRRPRRSGSGSSGPRPRARGTPGGGRPGSRPPRPGAGRPRAASATGRSALSPPPRPFRRVFEDDPLLLQAPAGLVRLGELAIPPRLLPLVEKGLLFRGEPVFSRGQEHAEDPVHRLQLRPHDRS